MIPISVCIIAKNEEENIEKCLQCLSKHPFEIIVVDTGSTDRTKESAQKYADKLLDFPWCNDFSKARNFSITHASHNWVLIIDCDEFVEKLDFTAIQKLIEEYPYAIGQLYRDNICYDKDHKLIHSYDHVERLFDRRLYYYTGNIHEQVTSRDGSQLYGFEIPLTVTHTGYSGSDDDLAAKAQRNINLLLTDLQKNPDDPYLYYQLGESFMLKGDYESAYSYYDQGFYLDVDENLEYVQRMIISYGYCMLYTNRIEKALSLENVYDSFCTIADFLFLMGNIYLQARQNDKALMEFLKATSCQRHFDEGTNSYRAYHNIGCIYEAYGQYEEARKFYLKAGNFPMSQERLANLPITTQNDIT